MFHHVSNVLALIVRDIGSKLPGYGGSRGVAVFLKRFFIIFISYKNCEGYKNIILKIRKNKLKCWNFSWKTIFEKKNLQTDDSLCGDEERQHHTNINHSNGIGGGGCHHQSITSMGSGSKGGGGGLSTVISARGAPEDTEDTESGGGGSRRGPQWLKCLFLGCFLLIAGISNWAVIAYTHDYVPRQPLPDVVFSLVGEQRWASSLGKSWIWKSYEK